MAVAHRDSKSLHVFLSAGDVSGDEHAARLIEQIRDLYPGARFSGLAGPAAQAAGCTLLHCLTDHAILGFSRAIRALPLFMGFLADAARFLERDRPDVCVLLDYPGFNLNLAALARSRGIPVVYYICPQLWAWAPWRVKRFARRVNRALVIFPFEEVFYREHGVEALFVGHPVVDSIERHRATAPTARSHRICLMPGSRTQEIEAHLPLMLSAARELARADPSLSFHCPHLDLRQHPLIRSLINAASDAPTPTLGTDYYEAIRTSQLCLVASGTATLEVGLLGTPMVVIYRIGKTLSLLGRLLLNVPYISQVNLIAGRPIVPEIVSAGNPLEMVVREARSLLEGPHRNQCLVELARLSKVVGPPGAAARAARAIIDLVRSEGIA